MCTGTQNVHAGRLGHTSAHTHKHTVHMSVLHVTGLPMVKYMGGVYPTGMKSNEWER